jgi:hypothetical protein
MPADVQRGPGPSGFADVVPKGNLWQLKINGNYIGKFTSPELAAHTRYYMLIAFQIGRAAYFQSGQFPMDERAAREFASRVPYGPVKSTVSAFLLPEPAAASEPSLEVPASVEKQEPHLLSDDQVGSWLARVGPKSPSIPNDTGGPPLSPATQASRICTNCEGPLVRGPGRPKHKDLCRDCSDLYKNWVKSGPSKETFKEYVGRMRKNRA